MCAKRWKYRVLNVWSTAMAKMVTAVISTMPGASAAIPSSTIANAKDGRRKCPVAIRGHCLSPYARVRLPR